MSWIEQIGALSVSWKNDPFINGLGIVVILPLCILITLGWAAWEIARDEKEGGSK